MKKSLLFVSALFMSAAAANAQITITMADVAMPTTVIKQATDTIVAPSIIGSSGISQTWNMTALGQDQLDTLTFIGPTWTPFLSSYPGTNEGLHFGGSSSSNYGYLTINSTGLSIQGNSSIQDFGGGPSTIKQHNMPPQKVMTFPSTYLSNFTNNYVTDATFYFGADPGIGFTLDSVRQKSVISGTANCDAWGTITTPLITTPTGCLRFYEVTMQTDSLWAYAFGTWNFVQETKDTMYHYSWWANGIGFPLVESDVDASDIPMNAKWLMATPAAGINEASENIDMKMYPNPAQNEVTFEVDAEKVASISVFDVSGRYVTSQLVSQDKVTINTSALANGSYTYVLISKQKSMMNRGKFTIAK
ncbi:MAG: T9SS type A sorting domain-containing protein [Bacteroidia bacterium]